MQIEQQNFLPVYGKETFLRPSFFTFSTHAIIWWGSSSEVSSSKYDDIRMETVKNNNGEDFVAVQGIYREKTSTFQDVCIYYEK